MDNTDLNRLNRRELLQVARDRSIKNANRFRKGDLVELIVKHQQSRFSFASTKNRQTTSLETKSPAESADAAMPSKASPETTQTLTPETITFSTEPTFQPEPPEQFTLPYSYNVTKIVLMMRDPNWAYTYWDIDESKYKEISHLFQSHAGGIKTILRVYDVTDIKFNGFNAHRVFDVDVNIDVKSWYLPVGIPDRDYLVDIGLLTDDGKFILIARSNVMRSPRDSVSDVIDENWMINDFDDIYALSGGMEVGLSSGEARRRKKLLFEQLISSGGISGVVASSPGLTKKEETPKNDFFLEVGTELILYGKTHSDASVTVAGNEVPLRPDGTFTIRHHLSEGKLELPVIAVSKDKENTRQITPTIRKDTR